MSKKILENYEQAVNDIIEDFCKKQDLDFEYWAGDYVGEVACFGDIFLNFDDIIHDLKNDAPKGLIIDWYFERLDNENQRINYRSYIMGARFESLKKIDSEEDEKGNSVFVDKTGNLSNKVPKNNDFTIERIEGTNDFKVKR